ncbi:MAG: hypothetical protein R2939_11380 [Kofleriaceae bacterium]
MVASLVLALAALPGCGGALTPPPPPLRPEPASTSATDTTPTDCDPIEPGSEEPRKTYLQRAPAIDEAEKLAREGVTELQAAENVEVDASARAAGIGRAVDLFITALLADPYNVNATYNLAAAYARIDRPQCSINMLERLIHMRDHASREDDVKAKLDRLLGRNRQSLDPDFNAMRADPRFRQMIEDMCANSTDPECGRGT